MKKCTFLAIIQGEATWTGSNAERVWDHAVTTSDKDIRWTYIESESQGTDEVIQQYCKYFGVEYIKPVSRPRKSMVDVWNKRIATHESMRGSVKPENMASFEARTKELKAELEKAMKFEKELSSI